MCFSKWKKRKKREHAEELLDEKEEQVRLEKHDKLALLLSAYGIFIPAAILVLGTILLFALLLFRVI